MFNDVGRSLKGVTMTNFGKFSGVDNSRASLEIASTSVATELHPLQVLQEIIKEDLGVILTEVNAIKNDGAVVHPKRKDFDKDGNGHELVVVFLSACDHRRVLVDMWTDDMNTPEPLWQVLVQRIDARVTSGHIHLFEHHPHGIASRIRLDARDCEHLPTIGHAKHDLAKLDLRYDATNKTRIIAKARTGDKRKGGAK